MASDVRRFLAYAGGTLWVRGVRRPCEPRKLMRCSRTGFTLIELLVVVAIISMLMAILLPSLKRAKDQAKQVQCANQQRNVSVAIQTYALENKGRHHAAWANRALRFRELFGKRYVIRPYTISGGLPNAGDAYWAALYDSYLNGGMEKGYYSPTIGLMGEKSLQGWENTRCPTAEYTLKTFRKVSGTGNPLPHDPYTLWSTLAFNGVVAGADDIPETGLKTLFEYRVISGSSKTRVPALLDRIRFPADMIMFHDGPEVMMDGNGDTLTQLSQWEDEEGDTASWIREYFRHPGGSVVTWVDGHTDTMSKAKAEAEKKRMEETYGSVTGVELRWYSEF